MLEDFSEFLKQEKTYYCMQPLAVVKIGDNKYELLDGQQRLTTLLILWRILFEDDKEKNTSYPYKFEYERDSSGSDTYSFITKFDDIKKGKYRNIVTNRYIRFSRRILSFNMVLNINRKAYEAHPTCLLQGVC